MKKTCLIHLFWLCAPFNFFGCGAETDSRGYSSYDAGKNDLSIVERDLGVEIELDSGQDNSISGFYGQRIILSGIAEVPVIGFQETNTVGLGLVKINDDEGLISYEIKTCETKIQRPDDIVTTLIPQTFIDSIPSYYRSGLITGDNIRFSQLVELNGVRLIDPLNDALPTEIDDPRIFDQDHDGFPGVTVFVSGLLSGQIHLVQRTITQLQGQITASGIVGLVDWDIDEFILDSDQDLLKMGAPITPNQDPSRSVVELKRIPANFTCTDLIENAPRLFDPEPLILNP